MAFSEKEKAYILNSNYDNLSNDKIFLLSEAELYNKKYFTTDRQWRAQNTDYTKASLSNGAADAEGWWLRSVNTNGWTGYITGSDIGSSIMYNNKYVNIKVPVRPAFNLNSASILFTSAAKGGKTKMASGLLENAAYSGAIYKLTMKDSSRKFTIKQHNETINVIDTAESIELNYSKAQTGDNEFISAMIVKNNEVLYYGQLAEVTAASGKVKFTIPSDIEGGVYELRLFNEQINGTNGNYATDFSSDFETVTLNVEKKCRRQVILLSKHRTI